MFRELAHFVRHAPATLRLKSKLPQHDLYEMLMARLDAAGFADQRAALVHDLTGDVLELGSGTGNMFPHYAEGTRVTAIEPDAAFAALSHAKAHNAPATIKVVDGSGESLPFSDTSFDAGVLALVLCSVGSAATVLAELHRVLRPRGRLRLIEHVRSPRAVAGWLMDRTDGLWLRLNGQGCHLNRDPLPALADAGFDVQRVEEFQVFSPGIPAFPMRWIDATKR